MACSTCDDYEFVPNPDDPDGMNIDCPDCRAVDERPLAWCPVHSRRVSLDGKCLYCAREAARATAAVVARTVHDAGIEEVATA
jgi:hypothetical protein